MKKQIKNKHQINTKFTLIKFCDLEYPSLDFLVEEFSKEIYDTASL
ncbi:hypothetical protein [Mycoplasmopsis alligatoris]|nr:hypothetical protein [Mycoplasmopsis alligatoris]